MTMWSHLAISRVGRRIWPVVIGTFVLAACTVVQPTDDQPRPNPDDRSTRSDAALGAAIADDEPGCSGAVGVEGDVVWTGTRGVADLSSGASLTPETVFDIGSASNQFTATAVLLLAADGKLRLEDPVSAYLGRLAPWADEVTVDHLIHHTSGLPDYVDLLQTQGYRPGDPTTQAQAMHAVAGVGSLLSTPGFRYRYSSSDYLLLAEIVRSVTGSPLPDFLTRTVFEPLDLDMTMDRSGRVPDQAASYRQTLGGGYEAVDWAWEQIGDGGIQTTPSELVRWADDYRTGRLGGSWLQYARLAGSARTSLSFPRQYEDTERFGAGIFVNLDGGLSQLGQWEGFVTAVEITPDRRVAAAVACNHSWHVPSAIAAILSVIWS
jgi:CubicO group peptidase (beta-lactamase class C family)